MKADKLTEIGMALNCLNDEIPYINEEEKEKKIY